MDLPDWLVSPAGISSASVYINSHPRALIQYNRLADARTQVDRISLFNALKSQLNFSVSTVRRIVLISRQRKESNFKTTRSFRKPVSNWSLSCGVLFHG